MINYKNNQQNALITRKWIFLIFFIIVLPLISVALSIHQYPTTAKVKATTQELNQLLQNKEKLLQQKKPQTRQCNICDINKEIKWYNFILHYAQPIALASIFLGILCAFIGTSSLLIIKRLGNKANQSSDQLYTNFTKAWKTMQFILLALPISLVLSVLLNLYLVKDQIIVPTIFATFSLIVLCWSSIKNYKSGHEEETVELLGQPITPQTNYKLWQLVQKTAQELHITPPDHIILGIDQDFFITNNTVMLHPQQTTLTGYTLYLPSTYLNYFSLEELTAVIAHELTHIANNDMNRNKHFHQQLNTLINNVLLLHQQIIFYPVALLSEHFFYSFKAAIYHWSRYNESIADANSIKVSTKEQTASALLKTLLLAPQIEQALESYYYQGYKQQLPLSYITQHITQPKPTTMTELLAEQPNVYDTHPTLAQRLASLKISLTPLLTDQITNIKPTQLLELFSNSDLHTLETNYQQTTHKTAQQTIDNITPLAHNHQKNITIKQGGIIRFLVAAISSIFFIIPIIHMLLSSDITAEALSLIISGGISAFCLFKSFIIYKRIGSILLTIMPEGIKLPCFNKVIPWNQIDNCYITENIKRKLHLFINPTFKLGTLIPCPLKIKYHLNNHHIQITIFSLKGKITIHDCHNLLSEYNEAYLARKELQKLTINND